jgi:hypothetical protein
MLFDGQSIEPRQRLVNLDIPQVLIKDRDPRDGFERRCIESFVPHHDPCPLFWNGMSLAGSGSGYIFSRR